jgi:hypothetical protein
MAHGRRNYVLPQQNTEADAPRNSKKAVYIAAAVAVAVVLTVTLVYTAPYLSNDGMEDSSMLAKTAAKKTKPQPVKFGDVITLKNPYNAYVITSMNGSPSTSGYMGKNDHWKIVSPSKKSGALKYGDTVALVGQNNRFLTSRYSGKVTCRRSKITNLGTFTVVGGTGGVMYGHQIVLKTEFGFLTGNPGGLRADAKQSTQIEHFFVGHPGKEDGLEAKPGLHFGMEVTLTNSKRETLQSDKNGWVYIRPKAPKVEKFSVLSPLHREGPVSFGDQVVLRAPTGKMVGVRGSGELQAVNTTPDLTCVFTLVGKSGLIHNHDAVALRSAAGYIAAADGAKRARLDTSGHFVPTYNFELHFDLHDKQEEAASKKKK